MSDYNAGLIGNEHCNIFVFRTIRNKHLKWFINHEHDNNFLKARKSLFLSLDGTSNTCCILFFNPSFQLKFQFRFSIAHLLSRKN